MPQSDGQPETGDLPFVVLIIWLILFVICAPPMLLLATWVLGPVPPINRRIIDLISSYAVLLLISFRQKRRYPGLVWFPGVALAALVAVFLFGG